MPPDNTNYRRRIYDAYVNARDVCLAPETLEGLRPRMPYLLDLVSRHFPQDRQAAILELGCGHGALLYTLAQCGYRNARGVDTSPEQVAAAHRLGIGGVKHGDIIDVLKASKPESLDAVVAFDVIEHFNKAELIDLTDEIYHVLRPGGRWIIHTPNAESPFGGRMRYWDYTHEQAFTRTSLAQLVKASGFREVRCFEDKPVVHGLKSGVRRVLWMGIRLGCLFYLAVETGTFDRNAVFSQNILAVAEKA